MAQARKPKRKALTKTLERKIIMEAQGKCPWCDKTVKAAEVEIHHIDEDRSNNSLENLLLVCRNHHGLISAGQIPRWEVILKKQILCNPGTMERLGLAPKSSAPQLPPVVGGDNNGIAGNNVHIETVNLQSKNKDGRRQVTPGLIEADPDMRTYATYLVKKYIEWRMKGVAIGMDRRKFSPGSAHSILAKGFGSSSSVLLIPQEKFLLWVVAAHAKIDRTVFGQQNNREGIRNYHSWEEHLNERH